MKRILGSLSFLSLVVSLGLFQQGCNIKFQVVNDPTPNLHRVERRIQVQTNQIDSAVQTGQLDHPLAQALFDNVDMVHGLALQYQASATQNEDLTGPQALFLNTLLTDNEAAINDAIQRHDQWGQAFQGGWNSGFATGQTRLMYLTYLNYQLERQQARIDDAVQNGRLSQDQSQPLRDRIRTIRGRVLNDYIQNGRLDLNPGQIHQLSQMVDDNDRFLRFRTQQGRGKWKGDHFRSWKVKGTENPNNPWVDRGNGQNPSDTGVHRYWDGRPQDRAAVATPTPSRVVLSRPRILPNQNKAGHDGTQAQKVVPTATSVPVVAAPPAATPVPQKSDMNANRNDAGNTTHPKGAGQGQGDGHAANSQSAVVVPTATPVVAVPPTATPVPVPANQNQAWKDKGSNPGQKATAPGGPTASNGTVKYLPLGPLQDRLQKQEVAYRKAMQGMGPGGNRSRFNDLNQKHNAVRKAFSDLQRQNGQRGITQAQMDQLSKMMDDLDKALAGPAPATPVPAPAK